MKKEWTEQDLREFVRSAQAAFEDVTLTEADEEAARSWQDDGLMVDYELRNGQVDCVPTCWLTWCANCAARSLRTARYGNCR
jgi:hypothetical protein